MAAHLFPRHLHNQLLLGFAGTLLVVGVLSGELYRKSDIIRVQADTQKETRKIFNILSATLLEAIISEDRPVLRAALEQVSRRSPTITQIRIVDESGGLLAQWESENPSRPAELVTFSDTIVFRGEEFGTMHVAWDLTSKQKEISLYVWRLYQASAVTLVLTTLILGLIVRRAVVQPIRKIDDRLNSLSRGDLNTQLTVHAASELERLGESVNALSRALRLHKEQEEQLRLAAKVLDSTSEGIMVTDTNGVIQSVNPAFTTVTGYTAKEVTGSTPGLLKSGHHGPDFYQEMWTTLVDTGQWRGEVWNRRKSGEFYPESLNISAIRAESGAATHYVGVFTDATSEHRSRQQLHELAYYDPLTGLPNRHLFYDRLDLALVQAERENDGLAVIFLDLDRFKDINDTLGHSFGDRLLKIVADRLHNALRAGDTIARLGGDEFTVLLPNCARPEDAAIVVQKLIETFSEPVILGQRELYVTTSVGVSVFPGNGVDRETLLKYADLAMYRAKEMGRNKYRFYTPDMNARALHRVNLESELRKALENGDLQLAFQPQVDCGTGRYVGVEALARWHHHEYGWVSPTTFIPLAEDMGLIGALGEWVLREACGKTTGWLDIAHQPFRVAVNISSRQLRDRTLVDVVTRTLEQTGLDGSCLELELTESVLMKNAEIAASTFRSLAEMGIQISIDDFGTGYSSLSYLKEFAIDKLKIDRSFIKGILDDADDQAIAGAIISMGHSLGLHVIAEGVELEEQLTFLRERGCDQIQGYLVGRPGPEISSLGCWRSE